MHNGEMLQPLTPDDLLFLRQTMGRMPRNALGVAVRCPAGHPCVLACYPLTPHPARHPEKRKPFPTCYWLVCPTLSHRLAVLESRGLIRQMESELQSDARFQQQIAGDHERSIRQREQWLTPQDRHWMQQQGWLAAQSARGIGGMTHWTSIKCLHLHLAHHLADADAIGQRLVERHGLTLCP